MENIRQEEPQKEYKDRTIDRTINHTIELDQYTNTIDHLNTENL